MCEFWGGGSEQGDRDLYTRQAATKHMRDVAQRGEELRRDVGGMWQQTYIHTPAAVSAAWLHRQPPARGIHPSDRACGKTRRNQSWTLVKRDTNEG